MRGFDDTTVTLLVPNFGPLDALRRAWTHVRHAICPLLFGGHELYRARTDTKLFQQCLLCGYETKGWTIDRRDRRLHLVSIGKKR